jgi:hypothetical protein
LTDFFGKDLLQQSDLAQFLIDRMIHAIGKRARALIALANFVTETAAPSIATAALG